jgi:hypothetical protein
MSSEKRPYGIGCLVVPRENPEVRKRLLPIDRRRTAKFDGILDLRQELNAIAIRISYVRKRNAGRMLATFDEGPSGRLDLRDGVVEA